MSSKSPEPKLCACGCGRPVVWSGRGRPPEYADGSRCKQRAYRQRVSARQTLCALLCRPRLHLEDLEPYLDVAGLQWPPGGWRALDCQAVLIALRAQLRVVGPDLEALQSRYFGEVRGMPPAVPMGTFHALPTTPLPPEIAGLACDCCAQRLLCCRCGRRYLGRYHAHYYDQGSQDGEGYAIGLSTSREPLPGPCCGGHALDPMGRDHLWQPETCPVDPVPPYKLREQQRHEPTARRPGGSRSHLLSPPVSGQEWRERGNLLKTADAALYYLAGRQGVRVPGAFHGRLAAADRERIIEELLAPAKIEIVRQDNDALIKALEAALSPDRLIEESRVRNVLALWGSYWVVSSARSQLSLWLDFGLHQVLPAERWTRRTCTWREAGRRDPAELAGVRVECRKHAYVMTGRACRLMLVEEGR